MASACNDAWHFLRTLVAITVGGSHIGAIITNNTFRYKRQLRGELGHLELIRFESGSQFPASGPWIGAHFSEAQFPQGRRAGHVSSEHQLVLRRDLAQTKPELAWCLEL